jgi:dipeptidyl aminopeptidase/acylaminoacyl peptidase
MAGRLLLVILACLAFCETAATAGNSGLPPLIERERFFDDPDIAAPLLSPDGRFMSFIRPYEGTRNVWIKAVSEPFDKARPITAERGTPVGRYFWSVDGKYVLFVKDNNGDGNYNLYAVSSAATAAKDRELPPARNLTNVSGSMVIVYRLPVGEPDSVYVGINDRDRAWHDLYKVRLSTGARELVRKNSERLAELFFDNDDRLRLATRVAADGSSELLRIEGEKLTPIHSCPIGDECRVNRFHADNRRVYLVTNAGADVDLMRLTLLDVDTGAEELVESDPEKRADLYAPIISDVTGKLLGTVYMGDRQRFQWRDAEWEREYQELVARLPGKELYVTGITRDEQLMLLTASSDIEPGETYIYDRRNRQLTFQFRIREDLPRDQLAQMKTIRYRSSDGLEIPAYLTLPRGVPGRNLPLLVFPHGGPTSREGWGFSTAAQLFANRGFAVLSMNFRGSIGYGKKFRAAGDRQWGENIQEDITAGVRYLIGQGIADPKRIAIMGYSFGGYCALAGAAFTPDLYSAAVAIVAPSNLITFLNGMPASAEAWRRVIYDRIGDPHTAEGRAQLERQSPLRAVSRIKIPMVIMHGANDPNVPRAEADQMVSALRARHLPVEYLVFDDEGHGFAKPLNNIVAWAVAERFLAQHVPGVRYQASMSHEAAARLEAVLRTRPSRGM